MTLASDKTQISYSIDKNNIIRSIDTNFMAFAKANGWDSAESDVIDRHLGEFISGNEIKLLTEKLIDKVRRTKHPISIPYRCDSPDARRYLEMRLQLFPDNQILFANRILRVIPQNLPGYSLLRSTNCEDSDCVCSWCNQAKLKDDQWVDIDVAIRSLDLMAGNPELKITHGLCNSCQAALTKASE
jgi:hypothetical protein